MFRSISLLSILSACLVASEVLSSPVLLWSTSDLVQAPVSLSTVSPQDLIFNSICKLNHEQLELRILAVNDLTVEDLQRGPQRNHSVLLDAKNTATQFRYFPNVAKDAYKTFSLIPQSNSMQCAHIHFQLTSNTIYETLEEALNAMQTMVDDIGAKSNSAVVLALVRGPTDNPRSPRERRQARSDDDGDKKVLVSADKTCMLYINQLYWNTLNGTQTSRRIYDLNFNESSCKTNQTNSSTIVDLVWNAADKSADVVRMSLTASIIGRYWYLEKAVLNGTEYRYFAYGMHYRMDTPPKYSYVCNSASFIRHNKTTKYGTYNFDDKFYLTDLQFQPFNGDGMQFGQVNYCNSFFTSGIWMGITSSLLCLAILLFGIYHLMAIKSNDRFDDPKGKPLLIKAQE